MRHGLSDGHPDRAAHPRRPHGHVRGRRRSGRSDAATRKQVEIGKPARRHAEVWRERLDWVADEWEVEIPIDKAGADTLVVFTSIEVMKFPENVAAIAKILNKAGEKWTVAAAGREVVNFGVFEGPPGADEGFSRPGLRRGQRARRQADHGRPNAAMPMMPCAGPPPNMMDVPKGIEITHIVR